MLYELIYLSFANLCQIKRNFVSSFFKGVKIDSFGIKNYAFKSDSLSLREVEFFIEYLLHSLV